MFEAVFVVGFFVVGGAWYVWSERRTKAAWMRAAVALELEMIKETGYLRIAGTTDGLDVELFQEPVSENGGKSAMMVCKVSFDQISAPVVFTHQRMTDSILQTLGLRSDLALGDEEFDKAVKIQAASIEDVSMFLTEGRKAAVLKLLDDRPLDQIEIGNQGVRVADSLMENETDQVVKFVREVVAVAKIMSD